jgi:hypothetical protein
MLQELRRSPSKGYQLIDIGPYWELHSPRGIYRGNFKKVCTYAALALGMSLDEIDVAIQEMEKQFHNGAEFGINRTFLFTFDKETHRGLH